MDAVEYLKAKARMTNGCKIGCTNCELSNYRNHYSNKCRVLERKHPEDAVAIVEKWAAEHPLKTRQNEFLKMFSNVSMCNGVIAIDPCDLDTGYDPPKGCRSECSDCRQDYWLAELPEDKG